MIKTPSIAGLTPLDDDGMSTTNGCQGKLMERRGPSLNRYELTPTAVDQAIDAAFAECVGQRFRTRATYQKPQIDQRAVVRLKKSGMVPKQIAYIMNCSTVYVNAILRGAA